MFRCYQFVDVPLVQNKEFAYFYLFILRILFTSTLLEYLILVSPAAFNKDGKSGSRKPPDPLDTTYAAARWMDNWGYLIALAATATVGLCGWIGIVPLLTGKVGFHLLHALLGRAPAS